MNSRTAGLARRAHDGVRSQLWPLPTLGVALALAAGLLVPLLDAAVDEHLRGWVDRVIFTGDAGSASTVLDAISSSLITVTSLTFSLTVVTLQLASSQFSPRLLRTFTQDLFVQVTLALFLSTFVYSLTVLRIVRSGDDGQSAFVPRIAVTTAFVLAVASVIGLVLFLAHLTRQIRVETMLEQVRHDAVATIRAVLQPRDEDSGARATSVPDPDTGDVVLARSTGFVMAVDEGPLREACRPGRLVVVTVAVGAFVVAGTPVARIHPVGRPTGGSDDRDRVEELIGDAIRVGTERTAAHDVGYGLQQLTDVAEKALSPGINDPTTAVHAIGHLSALLCELAHHQLGPVLVGGVDDDEGDGSAQERAGATADDRPPAGRVLLVRPGLDFLVDRVLTPLRHYGEDAAVVVVRLYELLDELTWHVDRTEHPLLARELRRLDASRSEAGFDEVTTAQLDALSRRVADRLLPAP